MCFALHPFKPAFGSAIESAFVSALESAIESAFVSALESAIESAFVSALESAHESALEPVLGSALKSAPASTCPRLPPPTQWLVRFRRVSQHSRGTAAALSH
jgi:hypothetical protein